MTVASTPFVLTRAGNQLHAVNHGAVGLTACGRPAHGPASDGDRSPLCAHCFPRDSVGHPYRDEDGTFDVAAYCRWLDEKANGGGHLPPVSTGPNPIPEPRRAT